MHKNHEGSEQDKDHEYEFFVIETNIARVILSAPTLEAAREEVENRRYSGDITRWENESSRIIAVREGELL